MKPTEKQQPPPRKADYRDATPEQVGRAVLKYRPAAKDQPGLSRANQPTGARTARQP